MCHTPHLLMRPGVLFCLVDMRVSPFARRPLRDLYSSAQASRSTRSKLNPLVANGYLDQMWPHFEIEPVAVHAQIGWGVSEAYESG